MKELFLISFLFPVLACAEKIYSLEDVIAKLNVLQHTLDEVMDVVFIQKEQNEQLELRLLENRKEFKQMKDQYIRTTQALETRIRKLEDITKSQQRDLMIQRESTIEEKRYNAQLNQRLTQLEKIHVPLKNPYDPKNWSLANAANGGTLPINSINMINAGRIQKRSVSHRSNVTGVIAFYAYMSSILRNPSTRQVLVFDVVKANVGNAYHPSTGVFIVPESGVYVFTWTFRSGNGDGHSLQLMINTVEFGSVYHRTLGNMETEETGIVVAQVTTGDDVYVRIKSIYLIGLAHYIQSDSDGRSSFAGWKL